MKQTKLIMGMPVTVEVIDATVSRVDLEGVFEWFRSVDDRFSTYKPDSEVSQINRGLPMSRWSDQMLEVMALCQQTKVETGGYFDIDNGRYLDPSGLVKGWAIQRAAAILTANGFKNFYIDAGGDIQTSGHNASGLPWRIGIRDPDFRHQVVKIVSTSSGAVATSGSYIRGSHIYNPYGQITAEDLVSLTVVGPDIYDADRYATAAFAMGSRGIEFIETLAGYEGYQIDSERQAAFTSGFNSWVAVNA